jgi:hypothetical protein
MTDEPEYLRWLEEDDGTVSIIDTEEQEKQTTHILELLTAPNAKHEAACDAIIELAATTSPAYARGVAFAAADAAMTLAFYGEHLSPLWGAWPARILRLAVTARGLTPNTTKENNTNA